MASKTTKAKSSDTGNQISPFDIFNLTPFYFKFNLLFSLEDAAKKVGISKKSLDDYLLQLRYGKKYGFDFNEHKEAKIGILRAFVKKCKQEEKGKQKGRADDNSD